MSELAELPQRFYDRDWNNRDASGIDEMIHPEFVRQGIAEVRDGMYLGGAECVEWLSLLQQLSIVPEDVLEKVLA